MGILFIGLLLLGMMYLFGFVIAMAQESGYYDSSANIDRSSYFYMGMNFFVLFIQEFLWQLWLSVIFISVIAKDTGKGPILDIVRGLIKKHYRPIILLVVILSYLFTLLPWTQFSIEYNISSNYFQHYLFFAIGVLFVFTLIEIVQKDKNLFDAMAASIRLLKGRYIFTFLILFVLMVCKRNVYSLASEAYGWIYTDFYNNISGFTQAEISTFYKKMSIILGTINGMASLLIMSIYYGAVIYLYKLYSKQDEEKMA